MPESNVISAVTGTDEAHPGRLDVTYIVDPERNAVSPATRLEVAEALSVDDSVDVLEDEGFLSMRSKVISDDEVTSDEDVGDGADFLDQISAEPEKMGKPSSPRFLPGALAGVDFSRTNTLWQLIKALTVKLPRNEFNMPVYIYRPDMLDVHKIVTAIALTTTTSSGSVGSAVQGTGIEEIQQELDTARYMLNYEEGFPTCGKGMPFWRQLDFEPPNAYNAFMAYIELGGARSINDIISYSQDDLVEWYHMYYWAERVLAFDSYKIVNHQKRKLQRMLSTEDSHYRMAERYLAKLGTYLDTIEFDADNGMTPDKAIGMMEKLVKIQRISVGLTANGERSEDASARRDPPVQVVMQQINNDGKQKDTQEDTKRFDILMTDPDALQKAQALILEMTAIKVTEDPLT